MTTAAQRLVELSGLPTGTASAHLVAMSYSGATAGDRLRSRSILQSGTAMQHLLSATAATPGPLFIVNVGRMMGR